MLYLKYFKINKSKLQKEDIAAFSFLLFLSNFPAGLTKQDFEIIKQINLLDEQYKDLMDKLIDYYKLTK